MTRTAGPKRERLLAAREAGRWRLNARTVTNGTSVRTDIRRARLPRDIVKWYSGMAWRGGVRNHQWLWQMAPNVT